MNTNEKTLNANANIKVGQWFRLKEIGTISQIKKISKFRDTMHYNYINKNSHISNLVFWEKDIKEGKVIFKDTPQELIDVDDLIKTSYSYLIEVHKVEKGFTKSYNDLVTILFSDVTKILTPNSNGGYNLQWSDE